MNHTKNSINVTICIGVFPVNMQGWTNEWWAFTVLTSIQYGNGIKLQLNTVDEKQSRLASKNENHVFGWEQIMHWKTDWMAVQFPTNICTNLEFDLLICMSIIRSIIVHENYRFLAKTTWSYVNWNNSFLLIGLLFKQVQWRNTETVQRSSTYECMSVVKFNTMYPHALRSFLSTEILRDFEAI